MKIVQRLIDPSKYGIKSPYEMTPTKFVVHNTANDAPAENEAAYMERNDQQKSFHYVVDDEKVLQCIPENRNAWHAGDGNGKGNREGIAIEICYSKSGGDKFTKAEQNAAEFIALKLKERGWGIDKVTKHQDYSGKYCPHRTLDLGWNRFLKMIESHLHAEPAQTTSAIKKGDKVRVNKGAKSYEGKSIASFVYNSTYTVDDINGSRAVLDQKGICTAFNVKDLTLVTASVSTPAPAPAPKPVAQTIKKGSKVKVKSGAKDYKGGKLASFVYKTVYTVLEEPKGDRAVIGLNGAVTAAVNIKDLILA